MSATLYFINRAKVETFTPENGGEPWNFPAPVELPGEALNVSNTRAGEILSALGFSFSSNGSEEVQVREFWAACQRYLGSELGEVIDGGKTSTRDGNWIECGRREGYLTEKIQRIKTDCEAALTLNATHAYLS